MYTAEIEGHLGQLVRFRTELAKWRMPCGCWTEAARASEKQFGFCRITNESSLRKSIVVTASMILDDNQSKCFALLGRKFGSHGPLASIVSDVFVPLWHIFRSEHRTSIDRLKVTRNNLDAHISRDAPTANVLRYQHGPDVCVTGAPPRYDIVTSTDILGGMPVFGSASLQYLHHLLQVVDLAQVEDIRCEMAANPERVLRQFKAQNNLNGLGHLGPIVGISLNG